MLAFGVGAFMPTPEIRLFCIANSYAMFMDFLYSITIYTAILVVGAGHEVGHQLWTKENCLKIDQREQAVNFNIICCLCLVVTNHSKRSEKC